MKPNFKQIKLAVIILIFGVLCSFGGYRFGVGKTNEKVKGINIFQSSKNNTSPKEIDFSLFWDVWGRVQNNYLYRKDLDFNKMYLGAISGMVASLGDPYTVFLPPDDNKEAKEDLRGDFEGVGIQIGYKNQRIAVISPLDGTPAWSAGVKAGDYITHITDEKRKIDKNASGLTLPEAVDIIRGPRGSFVKLTLERDGSKDPLVFNLKRETIVVKSVVVEFKQLSGKEVAVLKLSRFGERTNDEWNQTVEQIKKYEEENKNFAGIVLDLRNNPGGFLQGSVFIGSEFVPSGVVVLQDQGADGKEQYAVDRKGQLLKEPLIVLINGGSASASEIVAGFLQEVKRAKVIGEKSFGKGTIQEAEDLAGGAGLHITIARWLLPSGKSVDKEGVVPDIEVKVDQNSQTPQSADIQLQKALEVLTL